jgi:mycothiol synthase
MTGHPGSPRTVVVRGRVLTLSHRLDGEQLAAAAELLQTVIRADGHRGVGAGALEVLGGEAPGDDALAVLAAGDGGALDGFAFGQVVDGATWTVELTVRPGRRGRGLGGALLDAVLDAAPTGGPPLRPNVWAYRPGPAQRRLAERHGLVPLRHLHHLRGPTTAATTPQLTGGLRIRGLVPAGSRWQPGWTAADLDADREMSAAVHALVELHNAAFAYELLDDATAKVRLARSHMGPDHVLVADAPDGQLAGYVWMADPRPDGEGEGAGELVLLAVHPDWQGHRVGQALTAAGLELLARRGVERCMLYMDSANTPAARVYERAGFRLHHVDILFGPPG